ncbi:hypothetical protein Pfo_028349 [Paulownia fortunei]|nr:hypothetical protein Pfo_028349 [Paulownia fortunei]
MANHHASQAVAVVMVPLPAQGHINQLLHLSRLISAHDLPVYYVGTATLIRQAKTRVHGWDPSSSASMQFHEFPTPQFDNPPPNPNASTRFPSQLIPSLMAAMGLREPVYTFVNKLSTKFRKVVVIYDSLMSSVVQDIHSIQNAEAYRFQCASAFTIFSFHWETEGKPPVPHEAAEVLKESPPEDGFFTPEFYEYIYLQNEARKIFSGDIYDSSRVIEPLYFDLIAKEKAMGAEQIWALGPLNPGLRTGVEVVNWERRGEAVSSDTVEKAVRKLMASEEGEEIRKRAKELGEAVQQSFMEGGATRKEFGSFISHITRY